MYTLIIARGYPTKKYKMNGIFEFDQAKALARAGCKVVYAAIDVRSIRRWRKWGVECHEMEGVYVFAINIPGGRIPKFISQKLTIIGLNILYRKILTIHGKPDILHAHFPSVGYCALKLKNKINIPLIITEHSSAINKHKIDKHLFKIATIAYNGADAIIAVSQTLSDIIKDKFAIKTQIIPNTVDTDIFKYSFRNDDGKFNFVSTGNLIHTKRMDLTIEAYYRAFGTNDKFTLTIFGEGPERQNLEGLIEKYELKSQVKLMGMCSRNEIGEYFKKSDCFVLASQSETFGVAYIEALASGAPIIATKCGGPEGFINEENGLMINVDDINELTYAMRYIYENNSIYNRKRISEVTKALFSTERVAYRILEVYNNIF